MALTSIADTSVFVGNLPKQREISIFVRLPFLSGNQDLRICRKAINLSAKL
nr:MAG TPA: hypothetical protein [Caudoviricetes sp.]DAW45417.1 MAG TPA: hypothetical protein [Bacteriophage sp.]